MTEQVPRITKEEVRERMNELTILDVRSEKDWSRSDRKISGAHRETPGEENRWMEKYPKGQPYVLYCA